MPWFASNFYTTSWYETNWYYGATGATGFPTQYSGLRVYYDSTVYDLCLVSVSDAPSGMGGVLKVRKNNTTYAAYLVETSDPMASSIRIKTSTGVKAIRLKD
jgi:hypothetical protein